MKRIKALALMLVLSLCFVGNIFAVSPVAGTGMVGLAPGLLSLIFEQIFLSSGREDCPWRICQNCRPNNESGGTGNGDCRPPAAK